MKSEPKKLHYRAYEYQMEPAWALHLQGFL